MKLKRECINLKGMHNIVRSLQLIKTEQAKTHSSLARIEQTTEPKINERLVELALRKERQRFLRQDQSLERSLKNVAKERSILLGKKIRNQRVMALRKGLQEERYRREGAATSAQPAPLPEKRYRKVRLTY